MWLTTSDGTTNNLADYMNLSGPSGKGYPPSTEVPTTSDTFYTVMAWLFVIGLATWTVGQFVWRVEAMRHIGLVVLSTGGVA